MDLAPPGLRLLDLTRDDLPANLALDDALLRVLDEGDGPPCLRLWEWPTPAVVLGASGRIDREVAVEACRRDGVPIARRTSGGGTVVLGRGALNVAVVLPIAADPALRAVDTAQAWVMGRFAAAFRSAGAPVQVRGSGDLAVDDRKVAGSAQRRLRRALLVHASILYALDLATIPAYLATPARQPDYRRNRPHAEFVTHLPLGRPALVAACLAAWSVPADAPPPDVRWELVRSLAADPLSDPAWIARF